MTDDEAVSLVAYFLLALLGAAGLYFLVDKRALRDNGSDVERRPYSLARVQFWWWTLVVLGCWLVIWAYRFELWDFNSSCIALLGISASTTLIGRYIDDDHEKNGERPTKRNRESQGFLRDIFSDENGLSIHRFQCVFFNLALSFTFAVETLKHASKGFHEFDGQTLALLGISAGSYLTLKNTEGKGGIAKLLSPAPLAPSVVESVTVIERVSKPGEP